jgi:hypothetical protein
MKEGWKIYSQTPEGEVLDLLQKLQSLNAPLARPTSSTSWRPPSTVVVPTRETPIFDSVSLSL